MSVAVAQADYTGSLSTDNGTLIARDGWRSDYGGFTIAWAVKDNGTSWHYKYTLSAAGVDVNGDPTP
jgi:hypothetical protein